MGGRSCSQQPRAALRSGRGRTCAGWALLCLLAALLVTGFGRTIHLVAIPHGTDAAGHLVHLHATSGKARPPGQADERPGAWSERVQVDDCDLSSLQPAQPPEPGAPMMAARLSWELGVPPRGPANAFAPLPLLLVAPKLSPPTSA